MSSTENSQNLADRRMRRIRILRNGNAGFKGVTIHYKANRYDSMADLLRQVSTTLRKFVYVPASGVIGLYTVTGKLAKTLEAINENIYYAVCARETFKAFENDAPTPPHPPKPKRRPITVQVKAVTPKPVPSQRRSELPIRVDHVAPRFIIVIRHGARPRTVRRYLLNKRNSYTFRSAMDDINRQASNSNNIRYPVLVNQEGMEVKDLDDLFGFHYIFFGYDNKRQVNIDHFRLEPVEDEAVERLIAHSANSKHFTVRPYTSSTSTSYDPGRLPPQLSMKYSSVRQIAEGGFAQVYECTKINGEKCAMKIISKNQYSKSNHKLLCNELAIMRLRFPNLSRLISVHDASTHLYLIMDLFPGGDLFDAVMNGAIPEREAYAMSGDMATALFYIHSVNYAHRDLKPSNLLVTVAEGRRCLKLIDFGVAAKTLDTLYFECGTTAYMAPEMIRRTGHGTKVDVWAAGVTIHFMLTKYHPFAAHDEDTVKRLILRAKVDMSGEEWQGISWQAKQLIRKMIEYDKRKRFSSADVLRHPWIRGDFTSNDKPLLPPPSKPGTDPGNNNPGPSGAKHDKPNNNAGKGAEPKPTHKSGPKPGSKQDKQPHDGDKQPHDGDKQPHDAGKGPDQGAIDQCVQAESSTGEVCSTGIESTDYDVSDYSRMDDISTGSFECERELGEYSAVVAEEGALTEQRNHAIDVEDNGGDNSDDDEATYSEETSSDEDEEMRKTNYVGKGETRALSSPDESVVETDDLTGTDDEQWSLNEEELDTDFDSEADNIVALVNDCNTELKESVVTAEKAKVVYKDAKKFEQQGIRYAVELAKWSTAAYEKLKARAAIDNAGGDRKHEKMVNLKLGGETRSVFVNNRREVVIESDDSHDVHFEAEASSSRLEV